MTTGSSNSGGGMSMGGTGSVGGGATSSIGASSRMGTLTSAVSSKRSAVSGMGVGVESGMPSSVTGRTGSSSNVNLLSSDRRPLNVLNQVQWKDRVKSLMIMIFNISLNINVYYPFSKLSILNISTTKYFIRLVIKIKGSISEAQPSIIQLYL